MSCYDKPTGRWMSLLFTPALRRVVLPLQQRSTLYCLTPWLLSLATAAEDEAAIHHRPTVRLWQTKPTESIKPLFKRHFCALTPFLSLFSYFSYSNSISFISHFTFIVHVFSPLLSFPGWPHLSVSNCSFCQYYLYPSFCSASGEHADPQWKCKPWQEDWKKKKGTLQKEESEAWGLPKAIQLVSAAHETNAYWFFYFRGAKWFVRMLPI